MLLVFDTDHLSIMQQETQPDFERLAVRLTQQPLAVKATTIVTFQEQTQGWLAYLNAKARTAAQIIQGYSKLQGIIRNFSSLEVLPFDQNSHAHAENLRSRSVRIATLDLRIASIVLANNGILLSRNLRDFRKVPGLRVEDWTQ